jgi:hypothetical protein
MTDKKDSDAISRQQIGELMERLERMQSASLGELRSDISELRRYVGQVAEMSTTANVLENGFEVLSTQLAPLRDLAPTRVLLSDNQNLRLRNLRQALQRPDWTSVGTLSPRDRGVPFIGMTAPPPAAGQTTHFIFVAEGRAVQSAPGPGRDDA